MNQQEYQDTLLKQAQLAGEVHGHHSYIAGWVASQCVQMYELLTTEQQQIFSDKLINSIDELIREQDGKEVKDNTPKVH